MPEQNDTPKPSRTEKAVSEARASFEESSEKTLRLLRSAGEATTELALGELRATTHFLSDASKTLTRRRERAEGGSALAAGVREFADVAAELGRNIGDSIDRRAKALQQAAERLGDGLESPEKEPKAP